MSQTTKTLIIIRLFEIAVKINKTLTFPLYLSHTT